MKKKVGLFAYGEMGNPVLLALIKEFDIKWVILPPTEVQTLSEKLTENIAEKYKIQNLHFSNFDELYDLIKSDIPDAVIISTFNQILPGKLLHLTKFINVHLGDLPHFRGRANVNWAIINGKKKISVTIHQVVSDLDAGNIYDQKMVSILESDTVKTVYDKINLYLSENIFRVVGKVLSGYKGRAQIGKATYCCTRLPQDGLIDWNKKSRELYNFIRALTRPYPGAYTYFEGKKMIVWEAELPKTPKIYVGRIPGRIGSIIPNYGVEVLTGDSNIIIKKIYYQGKECNASKIIKSVKNTLGINWAEIYEKIYED